MLNALGFRQGSGKKKARKKTFIPNTPTCGKLVQKNTDSQVRAKSIGVTKSGRNGVSRSSLGSNSRRKQRRRTRTLTTQVSMDEAQRRNHFEKMQRRMRRFNTGSIVNGESPNSFNLQKESKDKF